MDEKTDFGNLPQGLEDSYFYRRTCFGGSGSFRLVECETRSVCQKRKRNSTGTSETGISDIRDEGDRPCEEGDSDIEQEEED